MLMVFENSLFFINDAARLLDLLCFCFSFNSFQDAYSDNSAASIFKSIRSCTTAGGFWGYLATVKYL